MESRVVGVNVEHVEGKVVAGEFQRLEHLCEREILAVAVNHNTVGFGLELLLDEHPTYCRLASLLTLRKQPRKERISKICFECY